MDEELISPYDLFISEAADDGAAAAKPRPNESILAYVAHEPARSTPPAPATRLERVVDAPWVVVTAGRSGRYRALVRVRRRLFGWSARELRTIGREVGVVLTAAVLLLVVGFASGRSSLFAVPSLEPSPAKAGPDTQAVPAAFDSAQARKGGTLIDVVPVRAGTHIVPPKGGTHIDPILTSRVPRIAPLPAAEVPPLVAATTHVPVSLPSSVAVTPRSEDAPRMEPPRIETRPSTPYPVETIQTAPIAVAALEPSRVADPPARRSHTAAIQDVLNQYRDAFNALDARAAHAVWPSVDERALVRAFGSIEEQVFALDRCAIDVKGARAVASCDGSVRYVPKAGNRTARMEPRAWTFNLRAVNDTWSIERVVTR